MATVPVQSAAGINVIADVSRQNRRFSVVILNDTRVDLHHGCTRVMSAIEQLLASIGANVIARVPAHSDWSLDPAVLAAMSRADMVLVNGEGTVHHDQPAGLRLLAVAAHARSLGIPAVLVNCGWQSNGPEAFERVRQFALIATRDEASALELRSEGVACRVVPDLSMYEAWTAAPAARQGLIFSDSVDRFVAVDLDMARRRISAGSLSVHTSRPGFRGAWRFHREVIARSDLAHPVFLARLIRARHAQFRCQSDTPAAFMARLAGSELLVSGRFHACTLAMVTRTAFVAAGTNTRKIETLLADAGLAPWRLTVPLQARELQRAREEGWSVGEKRALDDYLVRSREEAETLFRDLGKLV